MSRDKKWHWRVEPGQDASWKTTCGRDIEAEGLQYAEYVKEVVDCHVCLYHLGCYIPLSKLREHQLKNGKPTDPHDPGSCTCEPHEGPYHAASCPRSRYWNSCKFSQQLFGVCEHGRRD